MSTEMADIEEGRTVTVRATPPGSYMFGIKSFSSIVTELDVKNSIVKCLGSPEFESCGHKWKLSVYPCGDVKQGVEDHVSLYLVSTDADIKTEGYEIKATFKMFVYDHLRDNFLTVQDGGVRRFHRLKKEWGFGRLISLDRFRDAKNGYIVNDCCLFGVEIYVIPTRGKVGYLSLIKEPGDGKYTWKLQKFSTLGDAVRDSDIFRIQGHQWKLVIYPNGDSRVKGTHLSLYLCLHEKQKPAAVYAKYVLRIINHLKGKQHREVTYFSCFDSSKSWGLPKFILLDSLKKKSNGFIADNSVTFEVEVKCILRTDS